MQIDVTFWRKKNQTQTIRHLASLIALKTFLREVSDIIVAPTPIEAVGTFCLLQAPSVSLNCSFDYFE